jgi:general secretion pathway protein F
MKSVAGILGQVRDRVREGAPLSAALAASRADISKFEEATINVAERTASLDIVLVQLADFIEEHRKMKERIQHAMIYPALVLGLGICVSIVMLGFLVPRTQQIMSGVNASLPMLTRIMMAIGNGMWPWGILGIAGIVLLVSAWIRRIRSNKNLRIEYDRKIFGLPLIGSGYRLLTSVRFSRTLAILVRSGVPLVEGVVLAGRSTGSVWVEQLAESESESLRHGATLADTVRAIPPLGELLSGWIEVGEAGGNLAAMLDRAAERCQVHFDRFLNRLLVLLEPALLLFIGGFVLLITLSVMLPMFSLSSAIAK